MMENAIPKTKLKIHVLKLLKEIEETGMGVIITDKGKPVAKIIRYTEDPSDILKSLRNSVISYDAPTMPVGLEDWEALKSSSETLKEILYADEPNLLDLAGKIEFAEGYDYKALREGR